MIRDIPDIPDDSGARQTSVVLIPRDAGGAHERSFLDASLLPGASWGLLWSGGARAITKPARWSRQKEARSRFKVGWRLVAGHFRAAAVTVTEAAHSVASTHFE